MGINTYDVGDVARVTGNFYDASDNFADPAALSFVFKDPSGNSVTYVFGTDAELVKSATGVYYVDVDCDEVGDFHYRWVATGSGQGSEIGQFAVRPHGTT